MSLETLLEAAEFLEWRNQPKTRDGSPRDPHGYSRMSANDSDTSPDSSNSGRFRDEDGKDKRRTGGAGTREVHNKLEKNRRAHLKECFECLKKQIPTLEDKRTSNLSILRGSLRYIQALRRKEKEYELEMQKLAREKISLQERIATLKSELAKMNIEVDLNQWIKVPDEETESNSTSTATEQGSPIVSDIDDDEDDDLDDDDDHRRTKPQAYSHNVQESIKSSGNYVSTQRPELLTSQGAMTVLKVAPPAQPPIKSVKPGIQAAATSVITMVTSATTGTGHLSVPPQRPPVTQILAQTLNQRQLIQKQRNTVISSSDLVERSPVAQILAQQLNQKHYIPPSSKAFEKSPLHQTPDTVHAPHNLELLAQALSQTQRQVIQKSKSSDNISSQSSQGVTTSTEHVDKTPVTQILAQQLNQRQMLQRQKSIDSTVTTTQTSLAKSVPQIVKSLSVRPSQLAFTPINAQLMANPVTQLAALNRLATMGSVANQAALATIPMSTLAKTLAQPILVSTNFHLASQLSAPPLVATSTATATSPAVTTTTVATTSSVTTSLKTSTPQSDPLTTVSQALPVTSVTAVPSIRPIIGAPGGHFMASPLTPLNALLAQTIPRTSIGVIQTVPSPVTYATAAPTQTASLQQLMTLAQMAPGAQLFSPMTVVSPNGNLATGIPQAQLNNVLAQPLLKQIPFISPAGLLQGGQIGQMIGQPVVKPFVVVTVPSITTTTAPSAATVAMAVPVTTTS